ncbi:MAG: efflux RND transporter periplasmic adaptor subunit [Rhodoferax sp.]
MNLSKFCALSALALTLAACGPGGKPPSGGPGGPGGPRTPAVSVVTLQAQKVTLSSQLPGRTSAFRTAEIRPQVNGLIQKRLFTEGALVQAGQPLYQLDPAPFEAALATAQAALTRAEANLPAVRARAQRVQSLLGDKAVSQQDADDASAALQQAEAEVASWKAQVSAARINLGYTRITAPISGRIGRSSVTEGAIVTAYQPTALATIQQLDPMFVDVPQSSSDLLRLRRRIESGGLRAAAQGQAPVALLLEDGQRYTTRGTLAFRDVTVDPSTGSVTLRMVFPNPQGVLLPGMFVRAVVDEGALDAAILAPQQAVLRNPKGEPYAFVVDAENKVGMRLLKLERELGDQWLVTSGLSGGDRVIVEGVQTLQMLRPGTPVTVKAEPFQPASPTGPASSAPTAAAASASAAK